MPNDFRLFVITPEKVLLDKKVVSARFPGLQGSFGVMAHHAPMVAAIRPGEMIVRESESSSAAYFISDGYVEVRDNEVRVVAESGEPITEIDLNRAADAEKRARERVSFGLKGDIDLPRAEFALARSLARQLLAKKYRA